MNLKFLIVGALVLLTSVSALSIFGSNSVYSNDVYSFQINGGTVNDTCTIYSQVDNFILAYAQYDADLVRIYPQISTLKMNNLGNAYYAIDIDDRYPVYTNFTLTAECASAVTNKTILVLPYDPAVQVTNGVSNLTSEWNAFKVILFIIGALLAYIIYKVIVFHMTKKT